MLIEGRREEQSDITNAVVIHWRSRGDNLLLDMNKERQ